MIHPNTEVRWVNDIVGHGLYATAAISAGTITYAWDPLELEIWPDDARLTDPTILHTIERYSYIDGRGVRILSWDNAKYVNHSCNPNSLSTGYGFEIAIRDIAKGEQITDDYGLFNLPTPMEINCGEKGCRGRVTGEDLDRYWEEWDQLVRPAIDRFHSVAQPLARHLDESTTSQLRRYAEGKEDYLSVNNLRIAKA
jgi:hypothetical protein